MRKTITLFAFLAVFASRLRGDSGECDEVVLHAEPPAESPLARVVATTARVEVRVAPDGTVLAANAMAPRPPFVAGLSEDAARAWRFAPAMDSVERSYVVNFIYAPLGTSEEPPHWVVTRPDPLTLRVQYVLTTVLRLARDELGRIPEETCPLHRVPMEVGLVPLSYGLPHFYSPDDPADFAELRNARLAWRARERLFPRANVSALGGCTVGDETKAEVHYCGLCRRAREAWLGLYRGFEQYL